MDCQDLLEHAVIVDRKEYRVTLVGMEEMEEMESRVTKVMLHNTNYFYCAAVEIHEGNL